METQVETKDIRRTETKADSPTDNLDFSKILVSPSEVDVVISHINCSDGLAAAYSAWKLLGDKAQYHFVPAGAKRIPCDIEGKTVAVCDVCFNYETTLDIIKRAKGLVILDHHLSAQRDIDKIDEKYKVFDMKHSGAYLAWRFFHRNTEVPLFILQVQARDLWAKDKEKDAAFQENNDEFVESFYMIMPENFDKQETIMTAFAEYDKYLAKSMVDKAIDDGKLLLGVTRKEIDRVNKYSSVQLCSINNKVYMVAYVNSNSNKRSDIGNELLKKWKMADFSVVYGYTDKDNSTSFSLRSTDEGTDVSMIAKVFGGGGHRNASGCSRSGVHTTLPCTHYHLGNVNQLINNRIIRQQAFRSSEGKVETLNIAYLNCCMNMEVIGKWMCDKGLCHIAVLWYQRSFNDEDTEYTRYMGDSVHTVCMTGTAVAKYLKSKSDHLIGDVLAIEKDTRSDAYPDTYWVKLISNPLYMLMTGVMNIEEL